MGVFILENMKTTSHQVKDLINGKTERAIMASGEEEFFMVKE